MSWAQRLKRVFNIDNKACSECGGTVKVIACVEDPEVIRKILDHLKYKAETNERGQLPADKGGWGYEYPSSKAALIRMVPSLCVALKDARARLTADLSWVSCRSGPCARHSSH